MLKFQNNFLVPLVNSFDIFKIDQVQRSKLDMTDHEMIH